MRVGKKTARLWLELFEGRQVLFSKKQGCKLVNPACFRKLVAANLHRKVGKKK
ncbi:hypothetical protein NC99_11410 [Sunxiuqinia dokdonensis]|uniref:Uncharacterized protein n=1 Tax=Sunxiuqinia dokdonensis TaxID=1409788 RepID=A0A0L8VCZ3_9BACT|nr:hypothetical protein NC99_11410 [Sunxiuqinia dokdonensis]